MIFPINYQTIFMYFAHLKPAEARGLRRETVGLSVGTGRGCLCDWALREHQAGAAEDRGVVLLLDLRLLARLALLVVLLEGLDCRGLLSQEVDHEWHREIGKAVAPRQLHDDVEWDEVVTGVEHSDVTLLAANVDEL